MTAETAKIKNEIILYQPDNSIELEVMIDNDTVWLTQSQMTVLFETTKQNVSLHVKNILKDGELQQNSTVKDFLTVQNGQQNSVVAKFATTTQHGAIKGKIQRFRQKTVRFQQNGNESRGIVKEYLKRK